MIKLHLSPNDSITESLKPYDLNTPITIFLSRGVYIEKLFLNHHHLTIIGESMEDTIISYGDYAYKMHDDGLLYNTFRTSTVTVCGDYVHLENLTIQNTAGSGFTIGQAVALSLYGDQSKVIQCRLLGYQDTLFLGPLPKDLCERYEGFLKPEQLSDKPCVHYLESCEILGDVDFIFGSGTAFFNRCHVISIGKGFIAAPSTECGTRIGFVFYQSVIENKDQSDMILARPWRECGSTHFIDCRFVGHFSMNRYDTWDKENYRFFESPYIPSPFSKELNEEEKGQLIELVDYYAAVPKK